MNSMIEADIYGNVNSAHLMGSQVMNGIGGSGGFACPPSGGPDESSTTARIPNSDPLQDSPDRAMQSSCARHTLHPIDGALSWHARYIAEKTMRD